MLRKLKDVLRAVNLSEEEIRLYLTLVQKGPLSIPALRAEVHLPNITVYRTLGKLTDRGLVEARPMNKKQSLFAALSLEKLVGTLDKKQKNLRRLALALQDLDYLLPAMDLNSKNDEEVEIREGVDACKEEYLKMPDVFKDEYLHIGNCTRFWEVTNLHYESPEERAFLHKRFGKNLYARALNVRTPAAERIQERDSLEKRTLRFCKNIPVKNDFMMIAEDQVSHFVNDPDLPRVILIRNPEMVHMHRSQFEHLWKAGE